MFAVFIDQVSPRIYYVLEELFARRLHCELKIYTDQEHYKADSSPFKIQYVTAENTDLPGFVVIRDPFMLEEQVTLYFTPRVGHFFLSPRAQDTLNNKLLDCHNLKTESTRINQWVQKPCPCIFTNISPLGFDVFAMAFYFLSRYEEYQPFESDIHGRFGYKNAIESQWETPAVPHVDRAFFHFLSAINAEHLITQAKVVATFDIDIAFQFKGRTLKRQLFSMLRFPQLLFKRMAVLFGAKDAFDPGTTVVRFVKNKNVAHRIFWLCSKRVKGVNRQVNRNYAPFQSLLHTISKEHPIGLHPSFSLNPKETWQEEKQWLEAVTQQSIEHSRQHFVHLLFPDTYHRLQKMAIKHDWSMGYADNIGFRAGTAYDYHWFDLSHNTATDLVIHPFCIMDVTAKYYLTLSPAAAIDMGQTLKEMVFLFGGNFTFIAHNESLSQEMGWKDWLPVFENWANPYQSIDSSD